MSQWTSLPCTTSSRFDALVRFSASIRFSQLSKTCNSFQVKLKAMFFHFFFWQLFAKESLLIMPLRSYWSVSFCYLAIVYDRSWKCFWQTKVSLVGAVCVGDFLPIGLNLGSYFSWRFIISFSFNLTWPLDGISSAPHLCELDFPYSPNIGRHHCNWCP